VFVGNVQLVRQEEAHHEVDVQKEDHVRDPAPPSVAVPDVPVPDRLFAVSSQPIILFESEFLHAPATHNSRRNVGQTDIHDNVIEPALSEVGQDVLPGELDDFVEQVPEVDDEGVS